MNSSLARWAAFSAAALLAAGGLLLLATSPRRQAREAAAGVKENRGATVRVRTLRVTRRARRDRIRLPGVVMPARSVRLSAEIDGRIVALGAQEHEEVHTGQVLVKLDDKIRKAAVERAQAMVIRTQAAHRLAQLELERQRSLRTRGVASQADLDRAAAEERATFGALGEAKAALAEAAELLARTVIRAGFDGILARLDPEVGDLIRTGQLLGEVIDLSRVKIELGVSAAELVGLRHGDEITLHTSVYPRRAFGGEIDRLAAAADSVTRKFTAVVTASNAERLLLPGMVVEVTGELGDEELAIRIPRRSVLEEFGLTYVFVVHSNGDHAVVRRRRVVGRPVAFSPAEIEILSGLRPGEQIVTDSLRDVRDGLAVRVAEGR